MWAIWVALQRPDSFVVLASLRNLDEALGEAFSSVAAKATEIGRCGWVCVPRRPNRARRPVLRLYGGISSPGEG
jgi:hypothetical protein